METDSAAKRAMFWTEQAGEDFQEDIEKMAEINNKVKAQEVLQKAVSYLYKTIEIEDIFVFGSFVEGNFNEESDIDIAVFVKNWGKYTLKDFARQLFYIQNYISSRIELHFFPSKTEPLTFPEYIRNTGRKVA